MVVPISCYINRKFLQYNHISSFLLQLELLPLLGGTHSMYVMFWRSYRLLPLPGPAYWAIHPEACRCNCDSPAPSTGLYCRVSIRLIRIRIECQLASFSIGNSDESSSSHCGPQASQPASQPTSKCRAICQRPASGRCFSCVKVRN